MGLPWQVLRLRKLRRKMLCMCGLSGHHGRSLVQCDPTMRRKLRGSVELMLKHAGGMIFQFLRKLRNKPDGLKCGLWIFLEPAMG
jgi:hypothetical protein